VGFPFVDCWVAPNPKIRDFWPIFSKEQHRTKYQKVCNFSRFSAQINRDSRHIKKDIQALLVLVMCDMPKMVYLYLTAV